MIDDRNFERKTEQPDEVKRQRLIKNIKIGAIAVALAIFTVFVINVSLF